MTTWLTPPDPERGAVVRWVGEHLGHLGLETDGTVAFSPIRGGQRAADAALATFDVAGYAKRRNEVHPPGRRGASGLSPWIRHGLLTLTDVWNHVDGGPDRDVTKFRDELLWQEYARHWYARLGASTRRAVRREPVVRAEADSEWPRALPCVDLVVSELEDTGWLVNQTRMWLASQWTVRDGQAWQRGEDRFFQHLLDGSRAANRLGWQWTTGAGSSKPYGFSRWQVEKRAPGLCAGCALADACPIEDWPADPTFAEAAAVRATSIDDPSQVGGPLGAPAGRGAASVWLTAESLGLADPALAAHPDADVFFVFDEPLLQRLRLSTKRLVFLTETLAEIGEHRNLHLAVADPTLALADRNDLAVTFAPVPGFSPRCDAIGPVEVHPWPWLRFPNGGAISSFSAWRKQHR